MTTSLEKICRKSQTENIGAQIKRALESRDALEYKRLIDFYGISQIEAPDLYEQGSVEQKLFEEKEKQEEEKLYREYQRGLYKEFIQQTLLEGISPQEIFSQKQQKILLLQQYFNIRNARTGKETYTPLEQVSRARVGKIFLSYYKMATRFLSNP